MNYSDDLITNEQQKVKNGEREKVTIEQLQNWLGSDNPNGNMAELVLDIINDIYPVEDCVNEILEYSEELTQ